MRRVTITLPNDLEAELDTYLAGQDAPPTLTTLMQAALREYLRDKPWRERTYRPPKGPFNIDPVDVEDMRGETDLSVNHDAYFGKP